MQLIPNPHHAATLSQKPRMVPLSVAAQTVPVFTSKIAAGFPSPATDYGENALDVNAYLIPHPVSTFVFDVQGYSMMNAGILDGDKVVVDRAITPQSQNIVVAVVNGEFTIKRLIIKQGVYQLHPENPDFAVIEFHDGDQLEIWGVVTGSFRKF